MWWRQAGYGVAAATVAMLAMAATAAAAVPLIGADRYGETGALAAAAVVLATGGAVDLSASAAGGAPVRLDGYGELALRPLGVSLAGAMALGAALLLPLRRRPAGVPALAVRAGSAAVALVALAGLASRLARGSLTVPVASDSGNQELVIGFEAGTVRALAGALAWVLVVLAGCWLGGGRAPVPAGWRRWREAVRPPLVAVFTVTAVGAGMLVAGAAVAALAVDGGPALLGGALLAAPTALIVLVTVGLGARWEVGLAGPLGEGLDSRLAELGQEPALSLGRLAGESGGAGWLVPVAAAAGFLLASGVVTAARTPGSGPVARVAAVRGGWLALVLAVGLPAAAALAATTLDAGVSVLGNAFPLVRAELRTSVPLAGGLGLAGGAVAGFLGSLAIAALRRAPVRMLDGDD